jgi:flagellar P-ring protein precursor FlgI
MKKYLFILLVFIAMASVCDAARIKDIVDIQGVRGNSLEGVGLVIGLNGTGDNSLPSAQMLSSLLQRNGGVTFTRDELKSSNIAQVLVTAELGPWDREGSRIDVNVSAIGKASSLQGGQLISTELRGLDGEVYALARQSAISTASWTVEGNSGSKASKNHPTVGRIPNGAVVERAETSEFYEVIGGQRIITLLLRNTDFTTAERIRQSIDVLYPGVTYVEDAGTVRVGVPNEISSRNLVQFLDKVMSPEVKVDVPAVVVINERTGTIVVGGNVTITETAVAQGSLVVKIKEQQMVSQPMAPFTDSATTQVVDSTQISVSEEGHLIAVPQVLTVTELVKHLNAIGATPRDLIAIFNMLKVAGALQARIEIM